METFYHCTDNNDEIIFSTFPFELTYLINSNSNRNSPIDIKFIGKQKKGRFGFRRNDIGTLYICTIESKFVRSLKKFKKLLDLSLVALKPMIDLKQEINTSQTGLVQELVHNLISLNSYNIQDLFALIPQKSLTKNVNTQSETIKEIISEKPNVTVKTLQRQLKNNLTMKVEFSVFKKTQRKHPSIRIEENYIRDCVLSVLQIFILDFEEQEIEVRLGSCERKLNFDYEIFSVSLYYLFDNAAKYCTPKSIFNISFKEEADSFSIHFDMVSLRIEEKEIEKLTEKGYRSPTAKKKDEKGKGIGMYKLHKTLKFNNAALEIIPRCHDRNKTIGDFKFEANKFKIKFINQQNWFEAHNLK